jgi:hypothetical protein
MEIASINEQSTFIRDLYPLAFDIFLIYFLFIVI